MEYEKKLDHIINPIASYDMSSSKSKKGKYIEGAGITAGYYRRITSLLGIAFEAGYILPCKYKDNTLSAIDRETNDNNGVTEVAIVEQYAEQKNSYNKKPVFFFTGGVELNPVNDLTIALGGGYQLVTKDEVEEEVITEYKYEIAKSKQVISGYIGTLGIIKKIFSNSRIVLYFQMINFKFDSEGTRQDGNSMEIDQQFTSTQFHTGIAYTQYF